MSLVQQTTAAGNGSASPALTGVAAGNALVAVVSQVASAMRTYSASSNIDGALASAVQYNPDRAVAVLVLRNVSAGNHTVTIAANTGTVAIDVWLFEVSGLDNAASPIIPTGNGFTDAGATSTHYSAPAGEIDTAGATWMVSVGAIYFPMTATAAGSSPWTKATTAANVQAFAQYGDFASASTDERGQWTHTGTARKACATMVAFPLASGGGTTYQESITLSAVAALTDSSRAVFRSSIAMTADAAVADSGRADMVAAATLSAVAGFASEARADLVGATTLTADAGLSAVSVAQMVAALTLTADAPLAAASRLLAVAAATLTANATLTAADGGAQTYQESISLAANATLVHASVLQAVAAASLTADASLTGDAALRAAASLTFTLQATIDAAATQMHAAAVALDAQTGITAASRADYVASLTLAVAAVLQAAGTVAGAPSYTVLRIAAESLRAASATSETLRAADVTDEELL